MKKKIKINTFIYILLIIFYIILLISYINMKYEKKLNNIVQFDNYNYNVEKYSIGYIKGKKRKYYIYQYNQYGIMNIQINNRRIGLPMTVYIKQLIKMENDNFIVIATNSNRDIICYIFSDEIELIDVIYGYDSGNNYYSSENIIIQKNNTNEEVNREFYNLYLKDNKLDIKTIKKV